MSLATGTSKVGKIKTLFYSSDRNTWKHTFYNTLSCAKLYFKIYSNISAPRKYIQDSTKQLYHLILINDILIFPPLLCGLSLSQTLWKTNQKTRWNGLKRSFLTHCTRMKPHFAIALFWFGFCWFFFLNCRIFFSWPLKTIFSLVSVQQSHVLQLELKSTTAEYQLF